MYLRGSAYHMMKMYLTTWRLLADCLCSISGAPIVDFWPITDHEKARFPQTSFFILLTGYELLKFPCFGFAFSTTLRLFAYSFTTKNSQIDDITDGNSDCRGSHRRKRDQVERFPTADNGCLIDLCGGKWFYVQVSTDHQSPKIKKVEVNWSVHP